MHTAGTAGRGDTVVGAVGSVAGTEMGSGDGCSKHTSLVNLNCAATDLSWNRRWCWRCCGGNRLFSFRFRFRCPIKFFEGHLKELFQCEHSSGCRLCRFDCPKLVTIITRVINVSERSCIPRIQNDERYAFDFVRSQQNLNDTPFQVSIKFDRLPSTLDVSS